MSQKCEICHEREAVGRFFTLDRLKMSLCAECSKGLQPATWWKRRSPRTRLVIKLALLHLVVITVEVVAMYYLFRQLPEAWNI